MDQTARSIPVDAPALAAFDEARCALVDAWRDGLDVGTPLGAFRDACSAIMLELEIRRAGR